MGIGFVTGFLYLVAILYAINDYDALFDSAYPIAEIYRQATGSSAGAIGLLCLLLFCITLNVVGVYITAGRTLWTLARDRATPFPTFFSEVHPRLGMPLNATIACGILATVLGWYVPQAYTFGGVMLTEMDLVSTSAVPRRSTLSWAATSS
jgi:amino acid transporter